MKITVRQLKRLIREAVEDQEAVGVDTKTNKAEIKQTVLDQLDNALSVLQFYTDDEVDEAFKFLSKDANYVLNYCVNDGDINLLQSTFSQNRIDTMIRNWQKRAIWKLDIDLSDDELEDGLAELAEKLQAANLAYLNKNYKLRGK